MTPVPGVPRSDVRALCWKIVSVSVGGLWRTSVEVTADTTWEQLKEMIRNKTLIPIDCQQLTPGGEANSVCGLGVGDEVMCEWRKPGGGQHPLHCVGAVALGGDFCPLPTRC